MSVVDGVERARIVVALDSLDGAGATTLRSLRRWFPLVDRWPVEPRPSGRGVAVVHDRFGFVVHVTADDGGFDISGDHDGEPFEAAITRAGGTVDVVVADGVDPRRATDDALRTAAADRRLAAATAPAFGVETL
ncbi:hypothetical protein [Ilumatobacter sp.]|uniref:hypothetical protein n=1 Tax=Ilumatobacter sp. TaxID=1967498 RepID=UPI003B51802D